MILSGEMPVHIGPLTLESLSYIPRWTEHWLKPLHPEVYRLTLFSCPGYLTYATHQHNVPAGVGASHYYGAYDGGNLLGFIEYAVTGPGMFINNLCVNASARSQGVGTRLLEWVHQEAIRRACTFVRLDCFSWNHPALAYYLAQGYEAIGETFWSTGSNPYRTEGGNCGYLVRDYPFAEVSQQAFGFSTFHLGREGQTTAVGRIDRHAYRLVVGDEPPAADILRTLAALDPDRAIFLIHTTPGLTELSSLKRISSSLTMELSLAKREGGR
jgi:GNAT superfamily N-acetyltransferase